MKPSITIRDGIILTNFPEGVLEKIREKLEVPNDVYHMLMRKNKRKPWGISPVHKFYWMDGEEMKIPRGMEDQLLRYMELIGLEYNLRRRTISKKVDLQLKPVDTRDYQNPLIEAAVERGSGLFVAGTGVGKCHEKGMKVVMFDGSLKKVEDVKVGDILMGDDSTERRVTQTCEGVSRGYRIVPTKGEPFNVKHDHKLSLKHTTTKKIVNITVDEYIQKSKKFKHEYKLYRVPIIFPEKELEIEPYFLGLWLADGTARTSQITNPDEEIWEYLRSYAKRLRMEFKKYKYKNACETLNIVRSNKKGQESMVDKLRKIGVVNNKHIPKHFLINSRSNRLELLAGLLDGDGYYNKSGGFDWISVKEDLADQMVYLCRSLGLAAYKKQCEKSIKSINFRGVYYRVLISGDCSVIPNKVNRKKAPKRKQKKSVLVTGFSVEVLDHDIEYAGFELDGNKLYVQCDFIVAHNTVMSIELIRRLGKTATIIVPKLTLAAQFQKEMLDHFGYECGMINGKEKNIKDITVSTIQSLASNKTLLKELSDHTSVLIYDECQGVTSKSATHVFNSFRPEHYFGFTASPDRDDSTAPGVYFMFGEDPIVEYYKTQMKPRVEVYQTGHLVEPSHDYHEMIQDMVDHRERNHLITGIIGGCAFEGRKVLVLTKRIEHYEKFKEFFPPSQAFRYISSDDKNRDATLMRMKKGVEPFTVIFGTTSLLSVGVDIPELDTLILACDMSGKVLTTQSVGRVLRSLDGKREPVVIDLHDGYDWSIDMKNRGIEPQITNHTFHRQFKNRLDLYQSRGWTVEYKGGILPYNWLNNQGT